MKFLIVILFIYFSAVSCRTCRWEFRAGGIIDQTSLDRARTECETSWSIVYANEHRGNPGFPFRAKAIYRDRCMSGHGFICKKRTPPPKKDYYEYSDEDESVDLKRDSPQKENYYGYAEGDDSIHLNLDEEKKDDYDYED